MCRTFLGIIFCLYTLSVRATEVGLGVVYNNADVPVDLVYTNPNSTAVVIANIEISCGCLKLVAPPGRVEAGQTVQIPFTYHSTNTGDVFIEVKVISAQLGQILTHYLIHGFVCEKSWIIRPVELKSEEAVIYIDTREKGRFDSVHIPRSMNLPAFALKGRIDLKDRRVVLVDSGFAPEDLLETVRQLRSLGFSRVSMLLGGLPSWLRQGGAYEGIVPEPRLESASISAYEYARARQGGVWQEIEIGDLSIESVEDGPDWTKLRKIGTESLGGGRVQKNILVVAPSVSSYAQIEKHMQTDKIGAFYLRGGQAALEAYRIQQAKLGEKTNQRFQVRPAQGYPIIAGGSKSCGSCGNR